MERRVVPLTAVVVAVLVAVSAQAGPKDPIAGEAFDRLVESQNTALQDWLETRFSGIEGYAVTGPLDPGFDPGTKADTLYTVPRVLCAGRERFHRAVLTLQTVPNSSRSPNLDAFGITGLPGTLVNVDWGGGDATVLVTTYQSLRWLIWWRRVQTTTGAQGSAQDLRRYASTVAAYLASDGGIAPQAPADSSRAGDSEPDVVPPAAVDYGLPEWADLYPPKPAYVIEGYENYKDYLRAHSDVETWFADGVLAFVPSDSLLQVLERDAPDTAWPNKEAPLLQYEFANYFQRHGLLDEITTLTREVLSGLAEGEYFYAVGLNGKIRFALEMPREQVQRIEEETGRRLPRANHAFLFPGEPVLTAGAFFVERSPEARIAAVNTQSGHYFYSNVSPTVREDISVRSDRYLLTVGHFFKALDREGICHEGVLVSKM
jgi:hypothetical protein